jgi:hypothetical protein
VTTRGAALAYAARGWPVVPLHALTAAGRCTCGAAACPSPAKHPRPAHGSLDATADVGAISSWWGRWPNSNVGIATGRRSGLLVIDVDPRHGGGEAVAGLEREHGQLPETPEAVTGSGGRHILLRYPEGHHIRNSAGRLGRGLDVRGEGGYIVAPPSLHVSGWPYRWLAAREPEHVALADAPVWLLARLVAWESGGGPALPAGDGAIPEGTRNSTLASLAGAMRRHGASAGAILAALRQENRRCCPPLGDIELRTIAASIGRYPPAARAQP